MMMMMLLLGACAVSRVELFLTSICHFGDGTGHETRDLPFLLVPSYSVALIAVSDKRESVFDTGK